MMRPRSQSFRSPAENNRNRTSDLRASSSQMSSSGWLFNRGGKVNTATSMKNEQFQFFRYEGKKGNAESSASPQQQQLRVQEIAQSHCIEQRFLSKMRESGVVTSAGYQAVLHDFVASDRKVDQTTTTAAAGSNQIPGSATSTRIDRRAQMLEFRKSSSRRSSSRRRSSNRRGSSLRFSSFFTACGSSHEDEDFAFCNDVSENTAASDGRADIINAHRRSCRRGSSRRFGSFFTATAGDDNYDDFFDCDKSNRVEANIAPLRRSVQLTQEEMEYIENAVNDYDHSSRRWAMQSSLSITSSLSDSIHSNGEHGEDDEGNIQRLEMRIEDVGKNSTLPTNGRTLRRCGSNTSLNLNDIFDGIEAALERSPTTFPTASNEQIHTSDGAEVSANTRRTCTESVNFDPSKSKDDVASKSKEQETCEEQERSTLESSESSCNLDDCGWLPWPERRGSIMEGKDIESCHNLLALDGDNSFLPWPESPKNGRALAA